MCIFATKLQHNIVRLEHLHLQYKSMQFGAEHGITLPSRGHFTNYKGNQGPLKC